MKSEEQIWNYLRSQGFNEYGAAGVMGNLYAESNFSSNNLQNTYNKSLNMTDDEYTAAVDSGKYKNFVYDKAGYGIAQWTYWSRKQELLAFAQSKGKSIGDLEMQLQFLVKELNAYSGMTQSVKNASSVKEASDFILMNFERPASVGPNATEEQRTKTKNDRAGFGQTYYNKYAAKQTVVTGGGAMKYNSKNKPLQCMMTQSTCYRSTTKMTVRGILWHSTGANNPNLRRYVQPDDNAANKAELLKRLGTNAYHNDWNHVSVQAGLNAWVGKLADGSVTAVQTMPWDYKPWGCASGRNGSCNNGWIQFEICEDALNDRDYFNAVYQEACELTAYLCTLYNIDPHGTVKFNGVTVPTILCHQDSYQLGLGSNHGDVLHWFPKFGKNMSDVRNDVAKLIDGGWQPSNPVSVDYQGIVIADDGLNCRTFPVSGSVVKTYTYGTTLHITKEDNGWGYTGLGWVSLEYVQKVEDDDDMDVKRFGELFGEYRQGLQDNDCGSWSQEARDWATSTGLIAGGGNGADGKPNYMWADMLTREQAAQLFYRFAQMMGKA